MGDSKWNRLFLPETTAASFGALSLFTVPAAQHGKLKNALAPSLTGAILQPFTTTVVDTLRPRITSLPPGDCRKGSY
jgi:hypothetical protein